MFTILLILATILLTAIVGGFLVADYFDIAESQDGENGNNAQN